MPESQALRPGRPAFDPRKNRVAQDKLFDLTEAQEEYEMASERRLRAAHSARHAGARMDDIAAALKLTHTGARYYMGLIRRRRS